MPPPLKHDDKRPDWITDADEIAPFRLKALLSEPDSIEEETNLLEFASKQIEKRDEYEALNAAALDLIRLERYERRTWSRQKRAVRNFMNLKLMRALGDAGSRLPGSPRQSDEPSKPQID
jgi:hypothetical protein